MIRLWQQYLWIALLRGTPADLPAGTPGMAVAIATALVSYVLVGSLDADFSLVFQRALVDIALSAALLFGTLSVLSKPARFQQAFSALCGGSAVVNLAAAPLMWRLSQLPAGVEPGAGFMLPWTLLMGWLVAIQAHVLRTTLECSRALAIALAIGYLMVAFAVFDLVF